MWTDYLHASFLRGLGAGLCLALFLRWVLMRYGRTNPVSFASNILGNDAVSEAARQLINARNLLTEWIGMSIRFERVIHGDDAAGGADVVEAAALALRKKTFRVLEPESHRPARPPGPPATVG